MTGTETATTVYVVTTEVNGLPVVHGVFSTLDGAKASVSGDVPWEEADGDWWTWRKWSTCRIQVVQVDVERETVPS